MLALNDLNPLVATEVTGWLYVACGLAIYALLLLLDDRRKAPPAPARPETRPAAPKRSPGSEWQIFSAIADRTAAAGAAIADLQQGAAVQIDAAELSFNRMVNECAAVMAPPVSPTLVPARELASEVEADSQQLAA